MQDLKTYMKDVSTATAPALRPNDFPDEISYEVWKREESKSISQLIGAMVTSNPLLAISEPTEVRSSLLSDSADKELRRTISDTPGRYSVDVEQLNIANGRRPDFHRGISVDEVDEHIAKSSYTFVPDDPRAYYRKLLDITLRAGKAGLGGEEEEPSLFPPAARGLLNECASRWRVHSAAQSALLLDIVREQYDAGDLDIGDVNEAFSLADDWDYSSWPIADVSVSTVDPTNEARKCCWVAPWSVCTNPCCGTCTISSNVYLIRNPSIQNRFFSSSISTFTIILSSIKPSRT
jgi:hypothetical protein